MMTVTCATHLTYTDSTRSACCTCGYQLSVFPDQFCASANTYLDAFLLQYHNIVTISRTVCRFYDTSGHHFLFFVAHKRMILLCIIN
ncbi:hypothetical protein JOE11_004847 [Robbsia andropogonis]